MLIFNNNNMNLKRQYELPSQHVFYSGFHDLPFKQLCNWPESSI